MPHLAYLIIGGGMTADAAVRGIREIDRDGTIGVISGELHPPYNRPPLTKALWRGKPLDGIWRNTELLGVDLHLGRIAVSLDAHSKRVVDHQGTVYTFDKLLLATGGTPRRLPFQGDDIIYFRSLDDYRRLRELTSAKQRFAVVGGGFIGSEIAAALAINGKEVAMIFPGPGICSALFPEELSGFLNRYYGEHGVEVLPGETVTALSHRDDRLLLTTRGKGEWSIEVDAVVAGLGIEPNVQLAEAAGLPVVNGIVVDSLLRAGHADIYAAGDVANFENPLLHERMRVEHEDNALTMGRQAGRNMAGDASPYRHLPSFYSDLFDLGYEAVGKLDARLPTVIDWRDPYHKGVVYYLQDRRVRGVLLWNVWERLEPARALIAEPGPFAAADLKNRL